MNFSKTFLDSIRSSISLSDLIGEKVTWDQKKTKAGQGNFWCSCPFHQEKTASFHVDSKKGFYYCFGCQAKGDCFTFLKDHERFSFSDSVAYLANRAGIPLPKNSHGKELNKIETELFNIHQEASNFFIEQLKKPGGIACRQYVESREITSETLKHFEIGYASNSRTALYQHLKEKNFKTNDIISSGLCMIPENGGTPFDRFRNRVMFPIKDTRNRIIAFGGRSLDGNAPAKYLNSPETPLFFKGKVLYNYTNARASIKNKEPLLLVEGYMDVLALSEAEFSNTVAPLGTAITETQLQLLWQLDSEPIVLFDGDKAGQNAAIKLLLLALPSLDANKSLRFAKLPVDQDPDDFLKLQGRKKLMDVIGNAQPAINLLWENLTDGQIFDSPERKVKLDLRLQEQIKRIKNPNLRKHFSDTIRGMKSNFFSTLSQNWNSKNNNFTQGFSKKKKIERTAHLTETKNSFLGRTSVDSNLELRLKEGTIVLGCINHPSIAHELENELSRVDFRNSDLKKIRDAILAELPPADLKQKVFCDRINTRLKFDALNKLKKIPQLTIHPYLRPLTPKEKVVEAILDAINHHNSLINFQTEVALAENEFLDGNSEVIINRINKAKRKLQKAIKGSNPKNLTSDDITRASIKKLNSMIEDKIWLKKK